MCDLNCVLICVSVQLRELIEIVNCISSWILFSIEQTLNLPMHHASIHVEWCIGCS